jgi:hypothetical protein
MIPQLQVSHAEGSVNARSALWLPAFCSCEPPGNGGTLPNRQSIFLDRRSIASFSFGEHHRKKAG